MPGQVRYYLPMAAENRATNTAPIPSDSGENRADFTIRTARKSDIPEITRLNGQLGYPETPETIFRRFRRLRKDRRDHRLFVAVAGGSAGQPGRSVIGWTHVFIDKLLTVGPLGEIGGLVVDEQWRSRAVGAALLQRAEQWVQRKGYTGVVVHTNVVRKRAHSFYEKRGYKLIKQSKVYTKFISRDHGSS